MRIMLAERTREHVRIFHERTRDEEIQGMFPFGSLTCEEALLQYERSLEEGATSHGRVILCDGQYVGDVWCYGIDLEDGKDAMLSVVVFEKSLWGRGIATRAVAAFLQDLFDRFPLERVRAFTYASNGRSRAVLERTGFREIESFTEDGILSLHFELDRQAALSQRT